MELKIFKHPSLRNVVEDAIEYLEETVKHPTRYIDEAVADAKHDLEVLTRLASTDKLKAINLELLEALKKISHELTTREDRMTMLQSIEEITNTALAHAEEK
jgi:hypothetical protein